jgi:bifunctional non-homologous end joining protein LigD
MLATPGPQPIGDEWLHEVKWDGMRVLADLSNGALRLYSRSGREVTQTFPELMTIGGFAKDALIDGEIIALSDGVPSFAALADRMHVSDERLARRLGEHCPVTVMSFDLLRLYGVDLLGRPLEERRASLDKLELPGPQWRRSPIYDDGPALLEATQVQGLEGVLAKRRRSTYQPGRRSSDWVKTPHRFHQACVVGGWRSESGAIDRIGSLLIGIPDGDGQLSFSGRVGSGISGSDEKDLTRHLTALHCPKSPFSTPLSRLDAARATWCEPSLVVEVRHLGWTSAGRLRQPVFRGIRADLDLNEVRRER